MKTKLFMAFALCLSIPAVAIAGIPTNAVYAAETTTQNVENLIDEYYLSDIDNVKNRTAGGAGELAMAQKLSKQLGLPVGISGGANFLGCVLCGKDNAASVFADDNKKYLKKLQKSEINS